jgi:hypothetical protein
VVDCISICVLRVLRATRFRRYVFLQTDGKKSTDRLPVEAERAADGQKPGWNGARPNLKKIDTSPYPMAAPARHKSVAQKNCALRASWSPIEAERVADRQKKRMEDRGWQGCAKAARDLREPAVKTARKLRQVCARAVFDRAFGHPLSALPALFSGASGAQGKPVHPIFRTDGNLDGNFHKALLTAGLRIVLTGALTAVLKAVSTVPFTGGEKDFLRK